MTEEISGQQKGPLQLFAKVQSTGNDQQKNLTFILHSKSSDFGATELDNYIVYSITFTTLNTTACSLSLNSRATESRDVDQFQHYFSPLETLLMRFTNA